MNSPLSDRLFPILEEPLVCGKSGCGKSIMESNAHAQWWLAEVNSTGYPIVRCPTHISEWALRQTIGRTKKIYRWRKEAQEKDRQYQIQDSIYNPFFNPTDI
jgi:hypothetical protein